MIHTLCFSLQEAHDKGRDSAAGTETNPDQEREKTVTPPEGEEQQEKADQGIQPVKSLNLHFQNTSFTLQHFARVSTNKGFGLLSLHHSV